MNNYAWFSLVNKNEIVLQMYVLEVRSVQCTCICTSRLNIAGIITLQ